MARTRKNLDAEAIREMINEAILNAQTKRVEPPKVESQPQDEIFSKTIVRRQVKLAREIAEAVGKTKLTPEAKRWHNYLLDHCEKSQNAKADFKRISVDLYNLARAL